MGILDLLQLQLLLLELELLLLVLVEVVLEERGLLALHRDRLLRLIVAVRRLL